MRDLILNRLDEIGYSMIRPQTRDMKRIRHFKDTGRRLLDQMKWVQDQLDHGDIPQSLRPDQLPDDMLMALFEKAVSAKTLFHAQQQPIPLGNPKTLGTFFADGISYVEFSTYDAMTNDYRAPDMGVVHDWATEHAVGEFVVVGFAFMSFADKADALLCSVRFA